MDPPAHAPAISRTDAEEEEQADDQLEASVTVVAATAGKKRPAPSYALVTPNDSSSSLQQQQQQQQQQQDDAYRQSNSNSSKKQRTLDGSVHDSSLQQRGASSRVARRSLSLQLEDQHPGEELVEEPPETGTIHSISCTNFMCHKNFHVELNRHVNFICGNNGSGKSAILAAIQICLGAGARQTHRGNRLLDLVRRSDDPHEGPGRTARIRVTVCNQGTDAYRPDLYGQRITVERTISAQSNGYRLLDENGVRRSNSKKDLVEMLDTMCILVDNPVVVLDQEESKKFILGHSSDKFDFFCKATELERTDNAYVHTEGTVGEMEVAVYRIQENLQEARERVQQLQKKWEEHQALGRLEGKLLQLNTYWTWAYFNTLDQEYTQAIEERNVGQRKVERKQTEIVQTQQAVEKSRQDEQTRTERVEELASGANELAQEQRELEDELREASAPCRKIEQQLKALDRQQKAASQQLKRAKKELQQARSEIIAKASAKESEVARLTALLEETEQELATVRGRVEPVKDALVERRNACEAKDEPIQHAKDRVSAVQKQLRGVDDTLRSLRSSSGGNSVAVFGPRVAALAKLVSFALRLIRSFRLLNE